MRDLISKNLICRFKNIPKYERGSTFVESLKKKNNFNFNIYDKSSIEETFQKAMKRNKKVALLLLNLWNRGAFKGVISRKTGKQVTFEEAVDGVIGNLTKLAMSNYSKMNPNSPIDVTNKKRTSSSNGLIQMREAVHNARTGGMELLGNTQSNGLNITYKYISNLYPYGYSDEPGKTSLMGFISKIGGGFAGKSDKKKYLDEIIDLDLDDPELYLKAMSYRKYFDNFKNSNIRQILLSARLREDANRLYTGVPLKYNSFIINPDYESATAKSYGVPTYTFADPEIRKLYQRAGLAFNKLHNIGVHGTQDNLKTVFNRFTTVKSHPDGSGKYLEKWDLVGVPMNHVFIGDTIPANIGTGTPFTSNHDNTPTNFYDFVVSLINNKK